MDRGTIILAVVGVGAVLWFTRKPVVGTTPVAATSGNNALANQLAGFGFQAGGVALNGLSQYFSSQSTDSSGDTTVADDSQAG